MKRFFTLVAATIVAVFGFNVSATVYSLVGAFNSWANADTSTELVAQADGSYKIEGINISAGGFKVIADHGWATQWGSNGSKMEPGVDYVTGMNPNSQNIEFANTSATYKNCTVTFKLDGNTATINITGTGEAVVINSWCLCGVFNGWDIAAAPQFTKIGDGVFELKLDGLYGEFGIYAENKWDIGLKSNDANDPLVLGEEYVLGQNANLHFADAMTVYNGCTLTLKVTDTQKTLTITSTGQTQKDDEYALTGAFNGWKLEPNPFTAKGDGVYEIAIADTFEGEFKVAKNGSWDGSLGSNGEAIELNVPYALAVTDQNIAIKDNDKIVGATFTLTVAEDGSATLLMKGTSGVEAVKTADATIVASKGEISVSGAENVAVYTIGGALVSTEARSEVAPGMYIVKAGNTVSKVIVK